MRKNVIDAKVLGDLAIVITRGWNIGRYQDVEFNTEQWVTNVYRRYNEKWRCVFTQETPVSC